MSLVFKANHRRTIGNKSTCSAVAKNRRLISWLGKHRRPSRRQLPLSTQRVPHCFSSRCCLGSSKVKFDVQMRSQCCQMVLVANSFRKQQHAKLRSGFAFSKSSWPADPLLKKAERLVLSGVFWKWWEPSARNFWSGAAAESALNKLAGIMFVK